MQKEPEITQKHEKSNGNNEYLSMSSCLAVKPNSPAHILTLRIACFAISNYPSPMR